MKKILYFLLKLFVIAIIIAVVMFLDSYLTGVAIICLVLGYIFSGIRGSDGELHLATILFPVLLTFAILVQGVNGFRVVPVDGQMAIVSCFYPFGKVIQYGESVDTLHNVAFHFSQKNNESPKVDKFDLYRLYHSDNSVTLFTKNSILLRGQNVELVPRFYKYGWIDTVEYIDEDGNERATDLHGKDINDEGYFPQIVDISPTYDYYADD